MTNIFQTCSAAFHSMHKEKFFSKLQVGLCTLSNVFFHIITSRRLKSLLTHLPRNLHKPPVQIHVPSTACEVIHFKGQGQLCQVGEIFQAMPAFSQGGQRKRQKTI